MFDKPSFLAQFARYLRIFNICRISNLKFVEIGSASLLIQPYEVLLALVFYVAIIFLLHNFFFIFIIHFKSAGMNPGIVVFRFCSVATSHLAV